MFVMGNCLLSSGQKTGDTQQAIQKVAFIGSVAAIAEMKRLFLQTILIQNEQRAVDVTGEKFGSWHLAKRLSTMFGINTNVTQRPAKEFSISPSRNFAHSFLATAITVALCLQQYRKPLVGISFTTESTAWTTLRDTFLGMWSRLVVDAIT
jgi:hypothetical protein